MVVPLVEMAAQALAGEFPGLRWEKVTLRMAPKTFGQMGLKTSMLPQVVLVQNSKETARLVGFSKHTDVKKTLSDWLNRELDHAGGSGQDVRGAGGAGEKAGPA